MNAGKDKSPPPSETKRYNGIVAKVKRKKYHHKDGNRGERVNCELTRDDAGEQERLIFAALEQSLPAAKVGMKVSFNVRPWKKAGPWDYEAVNVTMFGHAPKKDPPPPEPVSGKRRRRGRRRKAEKAEPELTVPQLKAKCKELGISGYSKLRKAELVSKLEKAPEPKGPTGRSGKQRSARWWEFTEAKLDDYQIGDGPIEEGREFEGKFIDWNLVTGWQAYIECDALGYVYARQQNSIKGSMKDGEKVRFKVIVGEDNREKKQWEAIEWKSDYKRSLPVPPFTVVLRGALLPTEKIEAWLDANDDPVLAVIMMGAEPRGARRQKLKKKIADKLPGYPTTELKWPRITGGKIESHKMIHDHVACSVLIHPPGSVQPYLNESEKEEMEEQFTKCHSGKIGGNSCWVCLPCRLKIGVVKAAYKNQVLEQSRRKDWIILGDETGRLGEMRGEKAHRQSRMMWVVVPPRVSLPPLHPLFHAQDPELFADETLRALEGMANERDRINTFVFSHEKGAVPKALKNKGAGAASLPHLAYWQFTLPLVMEYVFSKAEKGDSLRIYVERMGGESQLAPRGQALAALVMEFADLYERRFGEESISGIEQQVLEKYPLEHAWLGYCDAIGLLNDDNEQPPEWHDPIQKIKEVCFEAPYRQDSLNSRIRMLLKTTDRPLMFLESLSGIPLNDMRDYVIPFLSSTISDCISDLNKGQWQELLTHMDHTSKDKEGQNATNLICRHMVVSDALDLLTRHTDRFDFLLMMLGTANHVGSVRTAQECQGHLEDILEKHGDKIRPERRKKMVTLSAGLDNNIFYFRHIDESLWISGDVDWNDAEEEVDAEDAHFYGAQALSRALRNRDDDFAQAWSIEKSLRERSEIQEYEKDIIRRWILRAELLLMEPERAEEALVALTGSETGEGGLPSLISDSVYDLMKKNPFYLAPLLKSCALLAKGEDEFEKYTATVTSSLNHDHPSQRISYWCARWADEIGLKESSVSKECLRHIIKMTDIEANFPGIKKMDEVARRKLLNFKTDAPGVILACELRDLESRGLIKFDSEAFLDRVLNNSHEKTREWVKAHWPDEEDWLRPLNFNYR